MTNIEVPRLSLYFGHSIVSAYTAVFLISADCWLLNRKSKLYMTHNIFADLRRHTPKNWELSPTGTCECGIVCQSEAEGRAVFWQFNTSSEECKRQPDHTHWHRHAGGLQPARALRMALRSDSCRYNGCRSRRQQPQLSIWCHHTRLVTIKQRMFVFA